MPPIVWYISGHGFGHASREIEIINALRDRRPDIPIVVRTGATRWIFDLTLRAPVDFQQTECDTGVVQIDSLRLDEAETVRRAAEFYARFDARVAAERDLLRSIRPSLVVGDVPPLAFAAARAADVPSIAIANFTWDWITRATSPSASARRTWCGRSGRPAPRPACSSGCRCGAGSRWRRQRPRATCRWSPGARPGTRIETRKALGLPVDRTLVLLSFGGHGLKGLSPAAFDTFGDEFVAVITGHLEMSEAAHRSRRGVIEFDEHGLYDAGWRYEDLVAAVDVVATKPGYGIIAECAAHQTAILYTSRGHFVEYEVLVREMPRYVRSQFIPQDALFAGEWRASLEALLRQDRPEPADVTGAAVAADVIVERL